MNYPVYIYIYIYMYIHRHTQTHTYIYDISDFRCGEDEVFTLLGCYAAYVGELLTDVSGQPFGFKGQAFP